MNIANSIIMHTMTELISSSSDSELWSDSSDEELLLLLDNVERLKVPKVRNYCATISQMHDKTFQQHFRLTRNSFEVVRRAIGPLLKSNNEGGHPNVPLEKTILSTIWLLANQNSFREVANLFDLSQSTAHNFFPQKLHAFAENISK